MSELLNNNAKFEMFQIDHDKDFNYVLNYRKKVIIVLKDLNKDEITEVDYNHMSLVAVFLTYYMVLSMCIKPVADQRLSFLSILLTKTIII